MTLKNKNINDWVVATYCDYGDVNKKIIFRKSYTTLAAQNWFVKKNHLYTCRGEWRIWQENKKGKVINDSKKLVLKNKKIDCEVITYCNYGKDGEKTIIRRSKSVKAAESWFRGKSFGFTNRGKYLVWQEDKNGKIINKSS